MSFGFPSPKGFYPVYVFRVLYKLEKPKVTPRKFLPYLGRTMGLEDDRISLYKPTNIALVMEDKELYVNKDELI
jgi:hypothetical protein